MRRFLVGAGTVALMGGCAMISEPAPNGSSDGPMTAEADLIHLRGARVAQATASQSGDTIRIRVDAVGLPAGTYGVHIHTAGRCELPDFSSAGPHWNPGAQQHGRNNPLGMHLGDLPNLMVGADGRGTLEIAVAGATISGRGAALLDQDGAAIIVHERPDDYRTDPSGDSGARIACGTFR